MKQNKGYEIEDDVIIINGDLNELDYVELYAKKLKEDSSLFKQHKKLIEAQLHGSSSLFRNMFAGKNFKKNARAYLKGRGLLD